MTAPGHIHVQTPIAGLVELALTRPRPSAMLIARRRPARRARWSAPASARLFVAAALARQGPLLVVTATGREADDLTAELRGVFGDAVAMFPSWETLPHERLSPGVDTVGARLMVLRRLAHPDDARLGPPLRVVVTTARSLLQPMAPDLGRDRAGDADASAERGRRRSTAVDRRGWSSWPTPGSTWSASAASSRSAAASSTSSRRPPNIRCASSSGATRSARCGCSRSPTSARSPRSPVDTLVAVACRELLLTDDVRERAAAAGSPSTRRPSSTSPARVGDMLAKLAEGIPVDGMEALLPVLRPDDLALLTRSTGRRARRCWSAIRRRSAPGPPT